MKKMAIILIILSLAAAFVICGKAFTQDDAPDGQEPVKEAGSTDTALLPESTETLIPYSAAYNSPDTGADRADVDEDSE